MCISAVYVQSRAVSIVTSQKNQRAPPGPSSGLLRRILALGFGMSIAVARTGGTERTFPVRMGARQAYGSVYALGVVGT
jgi:hypothetical protein